jgi:hypothetical protein
MAKTPLIAAASILLALTLATSCSKSGDSGNASSSGQTNFEGENFTENYDLEYLQDGSFAYYKLDEWYDCKEGGNLVKESVEYSEKIIYSINNRVLTWEHEYNWDYDTLNFAGTSNNIVGTWTRTKNRNANKPDWDIVKAELTPSVVKITRELCVTDEQANYGEWRGWKYTVTSCNTYEMHKGTDRVYIEYARNEDAYKATYKGKTCVDDRRTVAQRERACKKAWDEYGSTAVDLADYYENFLRSDFKDCMKRSGFPEELHGDYDDDDSIGAVSAKPLPKQKSQTHHKVITNSSQSNRILKNFLFFQK